MKKIFVPILSVLMLLMMSSAVLANENVDYPLLVNEEVDQNVLPSPDQEVEAQMKLIETIRTEWGGIVSRATHVKTTNLGTKIYHNYGGFTVAYRDLNGISGGVITVQRDANGVITAYIKKTPAGIFNMHRSSGTPGNPWTLGFEKDKIRYFD